MERRSQAHSLQHALGMRLRLHPIYVTDQTLRNLKFMNGGGAYSFTHRSTRTITPPSLLPLVYDLHPSLSAAQQIATLTGGRGGAAPPTAPTSIQFLRCNLVATDLHPIEKNMQVSLSPEGSSKTEHSLPALCTYHDYLLLIAGHRVVGVYR